MSSGLRLEGEHVIYEIEHMLAVRPGHPQWCGKEISTRDTGEANIGVEYQGKPWAETSPIAHAFSSCGECWQKTGIHGTFDQDIALKALHLATMANPGTKHRLVKRRYVVETTEVATMEIAKTEAA